MTLIALQQDFLPTDTLSNVVQDAGNPYLVIPGLVLLVAGVILIIQSPSFTAFLVGLFMVMGGGFVFTSGDGDSAVEYNESVKVATVKDASSFVSNIESAYDVEVVLPDDEDYAVTPEKKRSIIAVQDGVGYEALVSQDSDTYEPTLIMIATEASDITEFRKK